MTGSLKLLAPWLLPIELPQHSAHKKKLFKALDVVERLVLHAPEAEAKAELARVLSTLKEAETVPHTHTKRGENLNISEIKDYDQYFQFEHVSSDDPALTLARSLIETCLAFYQTYESHPILNPTHVEKQKQGFLTYSYLLRRVFEPKDTQ